MKRCFSALLSAVLFISCVNEEMIDVSRDVTPEEDMAGEDNGVYVPGQAYVYFSDEMAELIENDLAEGLVPTKSSELNRTFEELGITDMHRYFPHAGKFEARTRKAGLHKWYVVTYSDDVPRTKASETFLAIDGVELIEPVHQIEIKDFNDPGWSKLWGYDNVENPDYDINVRPVWENYTTGNPDVIVCVVDEGVDYKHEDLADNCLAEDMHFSAVRGSSKIVPGEHGTHVAGTIAAVNNNGKGISGIAGGDKAAGQAGVKILSCQIFVGNNRGGDSALAIKEGADRGAVISQNSWGYVFDKDGNGHLDAKELEVAKTTTIKQLDKDAIDYFIANAGYDENGHQVGPMAGGVVIFAAGNDASQYGAPADYEEVIAVGAFDSKGKKSDFSNYGDWVDIAAPGSDIYSTIPGGYQFNSGTSMACPHVSGVAALIVSKHGGPGFTNEMLKECLLEGSNKELISPSQKIGGMLDAYGAMRYIDGKDVTVNPVTDLKASARRNEVELSWTTTEDSKGGATYGFMVVYGTVKDDVEAADAENLSKVSYKTIIPGTAVGEEVKFTLSRLEFEKKYYAKVIAYSFSRRYADASSVEEATTEANNAPVITTTYEGSYELEAYQEIIIPVLVSDADEHKLTVTYASGSDADTFTSVPGGKWLITVVGRDADEGTYTAKVTATDEYGLATTKEFVYTILHNSVPEKLKEIDNVMMEEKGENFTFDMSEYVTDADGEPLKYEISISDPLVLYIVPKKDELLGTALGYGTADVTIRAVDARGEAAVFQFKVQVRKPDTAVSVYPGQVTDFVNISTLESGDSYIRIVSQTGKTVYEGTTATGAFEPARIDMSSCPPGIYVVTVISGEKEFKQTIVKL